MALLALRNWAVALLSLVFALVATGCDESTLGKCRFNLRAGAAGELREFRGWVYVGGENIAISDNPRLMHCEGTIFEGGTDTGVTAGLTIELKESSAQGAFVEYFEVDPEKPPYVGRGEVGVVRTFVGEYCGCNSARFAVQVLETDSEGREPQERLISEGRIDVFDHLCDNAEDVGIADLGSGRVRHQPRQACPAGPVYSSPASTEYDDDDLYVVAGGCYAGDCNSGCGSCSDDDYDDYDDGYGGGVAYYDDDYDSSGCEGDDDSAGCEPSDDSAGCESDNTDDAACRVSRRKGMAPAMQNYLLFALATLELGWRSRRKKRSRS